MCIGFVTEAMVEDASFFKSTFLDCLFYVLAVHHDYTPVHCSGVVSEGRGVLICGISGTGKTTVGLRLRPLRPPSTIRRCSPPADRSR